MEEQVIVGSTYPYFPVTLSLLSTFWCKKDNASKTCAVSHNLNVLNSVFLWNPTMESQTCHKIIEKNRIYFRIRAWHITVMILYKYACNRLRQRIYNLYAHCSMCTIALHKVMWSRETESYTCTIINLILNFL